MTHCELPKRPRVPARVFNRQPSQKESWGNVHGHPEHKNLIAQIFFATNDHDLDKDDLAVLEPLGDYMREYCRRYAMDAMKLFKFVGNADHRGSASYNMQLAEKRANRVKSYWDTLFFGYRHYESAAESKGESSASRSDAAGSRRVDIFSNVQVPRGVSVHMDDEILNGKYNGPRSNKFQFRTFFGAGVGIGIISGGVVTIEIKNSRTGRTMMYTYGGGGVGGGISFNRPTSWEEKTVPLHLDVDDFEGNGVITAAGVGQSYNLLSFFGPMERGLTTKPVVIPFSGFDFTVGGNADILGYWHRRD